LSRTLIAEPVDCNAQLGQRLFEDQDAPIGSFDEQRSRRYAARQYFHPNRIVIAKETSRDQMTAECRGDCRPKMVQPQISTTVVQAGERETMNFVYLFIAIVAEVEDTYLAAALTGLRKSELAKLEKRDIIFEPHPPTPPSTGGDKRQATRNRAPDSRGCRIAAPNLGQDARSNGTTLQDDAGTCHSGQRPGQGGHSEKGR
jgi:hypothetical protein